jgi:hypothetical protein
MKTGWVILIAVATLLLGFLAGAFAGSAGGAVGGGLAGVCYTAQIAVKDGMITADQKDTLLQSIASKHADVAGKLHFKGDLPSLCTDLLSRQR